MKFNKQLAGIKILFLDVDGVMTDGRIIYNDLGQEIKCFDVKDGNGIYLLIKAGIAVIIISGRQSGVTEPRARELGIQEVHQGIKDKGALCAQILQQKHLKPEEAAAMGDDVPDLALFEQVGLGIAVADAVPEALAAAQMITKKRGGRGAIREVCEWILKAKDLWPYSDGSSGSSGK
ncbi:MAG: phenylphosphate carboxylase subunit delta [Desulfobacteraceae bacterium]|nr:MAG: phenylphosphate carboxylase subunit delta [Desulfobacteraceae bacterium]